MAKSKSSTKTTALRGSTKARRSPKRKRPAFSLKAKVGIYSKVVGGWQSTAATAAEKVADAAGVLAMLARTTARPYEDDKTDQGDKALQDWHLVEYMAETIHGHYVETINALRSAQSMLDVLTNGGWSKTGGAR
jgi:hypothetical protein